MITKEHYRYGAFILACILVVIGLYGCGNSEEKVAAKTGPALEKYVDDYKKSMGIKGELEETDDKEYSLAINEDVFLFVQVDDKENVTSSYVAGTLEAAGTKELETAQKALIHSYDADLAEKDIYDVMNKMGIDDTTDKKTNTESIDGARLTYAVDSSVILKAEYK